MRYLVPMTQISKSPYKGCRDLFPKAKREQDYLFSKMKEIASLYAYEPYDGPMLELVDLYMAKSGEELINDQIYSFKDRGDRFVAIRPEMTPTVARMIAQVHRETPKPMRWYSIPNLMRYERPQKGRLREHWQFNCDIFGGPEVLSEIEVLEVIKDLLQHFGANDSHFSILINDRAIVNELFSNVLKVDEQTSYKLYKIIDKSKKLPSEKLEVLMDEVLSADQKENLKKYLAFDNFQDVFSFLDIESPLRELVEKVKETDLFKYLKYDPSIVRGLDYYTGIVFEVFDLHPDNRRAICGGGSYANLLQIFKESPLPGVGFGLGDVTLKDFLVTHELMPDFTQPDDAILVTFQSDEHEARAMQISREFRKSGFGVESNLKAIKVSKAFQLAEKKNYSYLVLIEGDEIVFKDLVNKKEIKSSSISDEIWDMLS